MDIHIWISIYGYPYMGSQGSLGWDTLGWDTLGGPMGPWDRWDLGTDGTGASRTLGLKDPGPQGPPIINLIEPGQTENSGSGELSRCRIPGYPGPVPDIRLPGPGAGYPAAGPVIRIPVRIPGFPGPVPATRLPGRPKKQKKTKKIEKKHFEVRKIDIMIVFRQ